MLTKDEARELCGRIEALTAAERAWRHSDTDDNQRARDDAYSSLIWWVHSHEGLV